MKPAVGTEKRTDGRLIDANQSYGNALHSTAEPSRARNSSDAATTSSADTLHRGRTSKSKPANRCCKRLKVSRTRRFRRLRSTARRATRLPTMIPKRGNCLPLADTCTRKRSLFAMRRERKRALNAPPSDRRARRGRASDRKPLAAFGAAAVENFPAAPRFHAGAEAVGPRTANLGGLVSAFHLGWKNIAKSCVLDGAPTLVVKCSGMLWITSRGW